MEGAADNTFMVCTTNCPWELDPAFLRRFQKRIFLPLPCRLDYCCMNITKQYGSRVMMVSSFSQKVAWRFAIPKACMMAVPKSVQNSFDTCRHSGLNSDTLHGVNNDLDLIKIIKLA